MKHITFTIITLFLSFVAFNATAQSYTIDTDASKLKWKGEKITGFHEGFIDLKSGTLELKDGKIVKGEFTIDMSSIDVTDLSGESRTNLQNHLKSDDFFGIEEHPEAQLSITESGSFEHGYAEVKADLTIKGITKPVTFKAIRSKIEGGQAFYAKITVDRTLFNVKYGSGKFFDDLGDKTIYDEFVMAVKIIALNK